MINDVFGHITLKTQIFFIEAPSKDKLEKGNEYTITKNESDLLFLMNKK